ncbi:MAG: FtsQ-type POTRA domain-containing protein [Chloroflexi bacterium]|nr:FtsQ-type POTRA domain-containing protein [Chloroflexota bacterium]
MRRVESAAAIPGTRLRMPKTARTRRRRNRQRTRIPVAGIKQFIFSARWISLSIVALCVYAIYLVGMDEHFYLTVIPVEGTISISPNEIVASSGLAGIHVFAADPSVAAERIAEIPGVISASVTLRWPNQVHVEIKEDSPIAVWIEGSNQYWITETGRFVPARSQTLGLLLIESERPLDPTIESPKTNQPSVVFVPDGVLAGAMQLRELRSNIERLYYQPATGLSFQDGRGWRVYFGTGTDMQQKLVVYETIVDELLAQDRTPVYVSVSNQEKPYYLAP